MKTYLLRAEWNNLVMANYVVPKEILLPYLPAKTELDFFEGKCYVTLAGFMFLNTKMRGFSVPFHTNFEEVNLRIYVKCNATKFKKKGVVFIKEIVPRRAISLVANSIYKQNYTTMSMRHFHRLEGNFLEVGYAWKYKDSWNKLSAKAHSKSMPICNGSFEEFIADHYWGYRKYNDTITYEYEVEHPRWEIFKVADYQIDCDFKSLYGPEFSTLNNTTPASVLLVKGSEIRVHPRRVLE
jgi:uncharacterized protein YqjF (DUF2071 family)